MKKRPTHSTLCACLFFVAGLFASNTSFGQICTREYNPLCGQVPGEPAPRTFANLCILQDAGASLLNQGNCASPRDMIIPAPATPKTPITGGDLDANGCKASAGYQWNAELARCVRH